MNLKIDLINKLNQLEVLITKTVIRKKFKKIKNHRRVNKEFQKFKSNNLGLLIKKNKKVTDYEFNFVFFFLN